MEAQLQLAKAASEQREGVLAQHRRRALALAAASPSAGAGEEGVLRPPHPGGEGAARLSMRQDMARRAARAHAVLAGEVVQARHSQHFLETSQLAQPETRLRPGPLMQPGASVSRQLSLRRAACVGSVHTQPTAWDHRTHVCPD